MYISHENKRINLTGRQVEKAVDWWAEQLLIPTQFTGGSVEGDLLGTLAASETKPTDEQLAIFKEALRDILRNRNEFLTTHGLHVDYAPSGPLAEAATVAGIDDHPFPAKTHMWFYHDGRVEVVLCYRGEPTEI